MRISLKPVRDQVIVITGASSGNGLATAEEAALRGARLVLVARNGEALRRIAAEMESRGTHVAVCEADVGIEGDVERIAHTAVERFGGFDSWVNNAAAAGYGRVEDVPFDDHKRIFDVNYFGVVKGSLLAAQHLRGKGGAIINIGSVLSDRAMIDQGPYSATKAAVQAFTDTLRMELERERAGVSVTLIKPAAIHTPYPEHASNYMAQPPRLPAPLYDPKLVADAVLFACENPRRQIYVGGGGYAISLAGKFVPRLTDLAMEQFGRRAQIMPEDSGDPAKRDNLYEPRRDGSVEGEQDLYVRRSSYLLEAQKNPLAAPFLLGMAGLSLVSDLIDQGVGRGRKL